MAQTSQKSPVRHKPKREVKEATHAATTADYEKLANAVVKAILLRKKDVYIRLPYFVTLADDWPRGILVHKDEMCNTYKVKTFKAADWLHKYNYLPADAHGIVLSMRDLTYREARLNKIFVDGGKESAYNDASGVEQIEKESTNDGE